MSTIIERFLLPLLCLMSIVYAFHSFSAESQLHKVYHHKGDQHLHLELANIVFYFSHQPHVHVLKENVFFFPGATIGSNECQSMISRINREVNPYSIMIEQTSQPTQGIQVTFNINPLHVTIDHESFDSIGLQKGVVFRLYNKKVLQALQARRDEPIIKVLMHKPCIAIDAGHGGSDGGAMGVGALQEKNVCLAISKYVAQFLKEQGYPVILTRTIDEDVGLDVRTTYANNQHADLFISIHANHSSNLSTQGVETFCMGQSLFKKNVCHLSAREQAIVMNMNNQRADSSYKLADLLQKNVCNAVADYHQVPVDRKVKYAVSQVLLGSQMPAALIEVGFLSNNDESTLLATQKYQKRVAQAIVNGIISFTIS